MPEMSRKRLTNNASIAWSEENRRKIIRRGRILFFPLSAFWYSRYRIPDTGKIHRRSQRQK